MAVVARNVMVGTENWGSSYMFEEVGDIFPVHTHETEADNHITIVSFGSIELLGRPEIEGMVISAEPGGTVINWEPGKPHGFKALTKGATILNLGKVRR